MTEIQEVNLYAKLARIMRQITTLEKGGETTAGAKYKFARDVDVYDMIRPMLAAENIAFFSSMKSVQQIDAQTSGGKDTVRTLCEFEFTFACADSGMMFTSNWFGEANGNDDKGVNKASTIALKFFLMKTFMISTGNPDDDPDYKGGNNQGKQKSEPTPPTTTPNRPMQPNTLISNLRRFAEEKSKAGGAVISEGQAKNLAMRLGKFLKVEKERHIFLYDVFQVQSCKDLRANQADALDNWLKGEAGFIIEECNLYLTALRNEQQA